MHLKYKTNINTIIHTYLCAHTVRSAISTIIITNTESSKPGYAVSCIEYIECTDQLIVGYKYCGYAVFSTLTFENRLEGVASWYGACLNG